MSMRASTGSSPATSPTAGKGKRLAIIRAAERLFISRRFHEVTMDDVAAAAKVAKGTLYGHFRDKDDLFFQTCTFGLDELCGRISSSVAEGEPFEEQLLTVCRQISDFYAERHQLLRIMQAEEGRTLNRPPCGRAGWNEKRTRLVEAVAKVLARGVAEGVVRNDVSLDVLANILMGMLRARARGYAHAPAKMRRHEVIVDLFCNGVTCRAGDRDAATTAGRSAIRKRRFSSK